MWSYFRNMFSRGKPAKVTAPVRPQPQPVPPKVEPNWWNIQKNLGDYKVPLEKRQDRVVYCFSHGAKSRKVVQFSAHQIASYRQIFEAQENSPHGERTALAQVLPMMDRYCAEVTGTTGDRPGIDMSGAKDQLDCVDEAINGTQFVLLLWRNGMIHHHQLVGPDWKQPSIFRIPHYGVRLADRKTGYHWAIDTGVSYPGGPVAIMYWSNFYR